MSISARPFLPRPRTGGPPPREPCRGALWRGFFFPTAVCRRLVAQKPQCESIARRFWQHRPVQIKVLAVKPHTAPLRRGLSLPPKANPAQVSEFGREIRTIKFRGAPAPGGWAPFFFPPIPPARFRDRGRLCHHFESADPTTCSGPKKGQPQLSTRRLNSRSSSCALNTRRWITPTDANSPASKGAVRPHKDQNPHQGPEHRLYRGISDGD
jgi:hypothetical protein